MKTRIGILGYGNLGRGIESAIRQSEDLELVAVFTRRDPASVKPRTNVPVVHADKAAEWKDKVDVLILCGGSATDLRGSLELLGAMRREKNLLTERLELMKKNIAHLERQHKAANLEYEKMKYLQTQDFSAQIEKIKKAEAAALDEFATMNFTRQKEAKA